MTGESKAGGTPVSVQAGLASDGPAVRIAIDGQRWTWTPEAALGVAVRLADEAGAARMAALLVAAMARQHLSPRTIDRVIDAANAIAREAAPDATPHE